MASSFSHPTITNFKGALSGHGARANLFEVTLSTPTNTKIPFFIGMPI